MLKRNVGGMNLKKLSKDYFEQARQSITKYGRPLEKAIFNKYFSQGSEQEILNELKKFQNEDGGFGHGIESDFRLPLSTSMATSIGLRILSDIEETDESSQMIKSALGYLETSFDKKRNGWFAVNKEVNNYPHAFWWHFNEESNVSIIDRNWGNPSAEIIAYLYKYRHYVQTLDIEGLVEYAINQIEIKQEFNSENEIFCYIKLYEVLPKKFKERLENRIVFAIKQVIVYDEHEWHRYVPRPIEFVKKIDSNKFGILVSKLNDNLNFVIEELELNGKMNPPWDKSYYEGDLKQAYNEWIGVLTLKALITLDRFKRICV